MADDERPAWVDYWSPGGAPAHLDPRFPPFNPNWKAAEHEAGIGFYCPWEEVYAGFPEHGRRLAVALRAQGIPLQLRSSRGGLQWQTTKDVSLARAYENMKRWLEPLLQASIKRYKAEVWHVVSDDATFHRLATPAHPYLDPRELEHIYKRRIFSTVFERDRVSKDVAECLGRVGQIWVANKKDWAMLVRSGVRHDKVHVVPIPYFPNDPHAALDGRARLPGPVRFYHIGKWEPRKDQHGILGVFLRAFEPGECKLYMKTSAWGPKLKSGYPESPQESLSRWLTEPQVTARGWTIDNIGRDVFLIQQRLPAERLVALHRQADVYVTLSRGEGFDMPAFDAKLAGNLMVYTPSGGPQSFAGRHDPCVEATGSIPADPFYGWHDACYLDYDGDAAVAAMRQAKLMVEKGLRVRGRDDFEAVFSAKVVGAQARALVDELTEGP